VVGPKPLSRRQKAVSYVRQAVHRPKSDEVFYSSFAGRFSDNPRGVFEAIVRRHPHLHHTWHSDGTAAFPPEVRTVATSDRRYSSALGRAGLVVANASVPQYVRRAGATYLQTWHGTPLKRIGLDNPFRQSGTAGHARAVRDYAQWDLLLSQNPHSTEVFRRAFAYDGEVLEVGYPRNDALLSAEAPAVRRQLREALGLSDDVTAVLYAPTFRDDTVDAAAATVPVDLARLRAALGDRVTVLLRLHHWVAGRLGDLHGAIDVSAHGDIRDLYLAADALVTDYSSAIFDFAVTRKPIVLFTPDLDHYRESLRVMYFVIVVQAPGPVCRSDDELITALGGDLDGMSRTPQYDEFAARYCPWDDGVAGDRVVDRVRLLTAE
jgi:CDP-glycerol glycerophosphotransferase